MSHQSIAAVWSKIEKRTDLGATLREAIGQYAIDVSLGGEDRLAPKSLQAFDHLVSLIKVTFHLQRTYLQPRAPSHNIQQFLLAPSQVADVLHFLLTIKDHCSHAAQRRHAATSHVLRAIGGVLLSGLRLLTLCKGKVSYEENVDWVWLARSLRPRLQDWPGDEDSVERFLIRDLCVACLQDLSLSTPLASTGLIYSASKYVACRLHAADTGAHGQLDLPDYNDGLFPLNPKLVEVVAEAQTCMQCQYQCQWWFQSFCTWYDAWSALIAASVQLYSRISNANESSSTHPAIRGTLSEPCSSFVNFYVRMTYEAMNAPDAARSRLYIIKKTILTLSPFPNCSGYGCDCFDARLQHENQATSRVTPEGSAEPVDPHHTVAHDLERRQRSLQDPNGRVQQLQRSLEGQVGVWTATNRLNLESPDRSPEPKHMASYVVNCPKMHPLTRSTIKRLLEDSDDGVGIEEIRSSAELVKVGGIKCPRCRNPESAKFTQARLVKPLVDLNDDLKAALVPTPKTQKPLRRIVTQASPLKRNSTATEPTPTTPVRSPSQGYPTLQPALINHSRSGSGDNTSHSSSKGRRSIWKSGSSSPSIHVSYAMFADARFALAYTSNRISCYDCELRTWSHGYSFNGICMAAGSLCRYAVISKGATAYTLSVLRRDHEEEYEEWPSKDLPAQPYSLAVSRDGERVAVGFVDTIQLYHGATGTVQSLPTPKPSKPSKPSKPPKEGAPFTVDSQCLSFSVDASHLVVATRETRDGFVFTGVYDLRPACHSARQMQTIRIPSNLPRDFHLSSVVYDQFSRTVGVCSSTAQGHTHLINSVSTVPTAMTPRDLNPFPGDQIQCAVVVPDSPPRIALVNDGNNVFILEYSYQESRWMPKSIPVKLGKGRKGVNKFDEKMSIAAATDGTIRMFWMQGEEGRILSIDTGQGGPFEPEIIPTTPF